MTSGPLGYVALWTVVSALGAAAVALLLSRAADPRDVVLFGSCSPQLLLYGGTNVDAIPVALLVAAVLLSRAGRGTAAIVALAVGTVTKVFPAVVAPLELDRLRRDRGPAAMAAAAAIFAAVAVAISLPSVLAQFPSTEGVLHQAGRTNVDSVWGIALGLLEGLGVPGAGQLLGLLAAAGLVLTYVLLVLPRARRSADPARGALLAVLALLLWSRLFSPQYTLWVLPFFVLLGLGVRRYALLSFADLVVFVSVYPLTLVPWRADDPVATGLLGLVAVGVVLRHVALIAVWRGWSVPVERSRAAA